MVVTNVTKSVLSTVFITLLCLAQPTYGAVLPEDRADIFYHEYKGDESTFKGPSILVRKQFAEKVSVWGNYYVDMNTAASIDVQTQSSASYEEERVETAGGIDFLYDRTLLSVGYINSDENDYEAQTFTFGLSQEFFGDLSTFTLGYAKGKDDIFKNNRLEGEITGREFVDKAEHQRFSIGWTQILTKSWIVSFNAEASVDEGFLNNPYRNVRYFGGNDGSGNPIALGEPENYPRTRNSQAYAVKSMYYLPYRAAVKLEYRTFSDSWDIEASNYEIRYTHPYKKNWLFELRYRYYEQTQAEFYSDLFNFAGEFNFRASDKELSTFDNNAIGFGVTYEFEPKWAKWIDKSTVNLFYDRVSYQYENFRDRRLSRSTEDGGDAAFFAGEEPQFSFDADVLRFFISIWY